MNRPKILFVVSEDWYFLSHRLALARAIRDAGCQVAVAAAQGDRVREIMDEDFSFHPIRMQRGSLNPWKEYTAYRDLKRLFKELKPDLAHLVAIKPILYGGVAAKRTGVNGVVCAVAGVGYVFYPGHFTRTLLRRFVELTYRLHLRGRQGVRFILQNPDDKALFLDRALAREDQIRIIVGNGIDTNRFSPSPEPEGKVTVFMHSRMLWDKGVGDLAEASRLLKAQGQDLDVVLAGDPDPSNPASVPADTLEQWSREGLVTWLGRKADIPGLMAKAHIACLPSYREGAPQSLMEAAACGKPIVTTDVPGCREIVRQEENGLLVPARDPQALATALARLAQDPKLRSHMGAKSRQLAEQMFSREVVIAQSIEIYKELLGDIWPG
ncbi:MAG: glycosyltransferase family 1 protein [Desulfovibrio sp.]|nr:MAG: glycosyltransferase family 1 protein [Desulfovibrio sp.]